MKVLVTGADGFIGSHLVEKLVDEKYDVKAFVLYNPQNSLGWLENTPEKLKNNLDIVFGDIRDAHGVYQAVKGCDAVIHLAALISIPYSYVSPDSYVETNILGTMNILQATRSLGIKKVIHTSTSEVYGTAKIVPINEDHPLQPQSPYSASKISSDNLAMSFFNSFDTPVTIIRPFNTFGPRQSNRAIIPTIITQILNGETNIKLGSLHPTRDFNYISDTVNGFFNALKTNGIEGKTINIGSNFEVSILEIVNIIISIINKKVKIHTDIKRVRPKKSEVDRLIADNSLAKKILNWEPKFYGKDGLREGLAKTIEWFKDPENIKRYNHTKYNI
tara:strand:- start:2905 stop:3900 length:996 start_codon:yes stop_codon:yes gene_type:complete